MCLWIFDRCSIDFQGLGDVWGRNGGGCVHGCSIDVQLCFKGWGIFWRRVGGGCVHGCSIDVRLIFKGWEIFGGGLEEDVSMDAG